MNVAGDTFVELDEQFTVTLSNATDGVIVGASASSTILNDDTFVSIASNSVVEGNAGTTSMSFTLTRTGITTGASSVDWTVSAGSGANPASSSDFAGNALPSGNVTFAAGEISKTFTIDVQGETVIEPDETFLVTLSNPTGTAIATTPTANGTILNDDFQALVAGDIVVTGWNTTNPDQFAFVPLVDLVPGSIIKFTDNAWTGTALTTNEGTLVYVAPTTGLPAGTKVVIDKDTTANTATFLAGAGAATFGSNFSFNQTGDNLFIYTGLDSSPSFLFGLTTNSSYLTGSATVGTSTTFLPSTLTAGATALAPLATTGTIANAQYNNSLTIGSRANLLAAVADVTRWTTSATALALDTSNFTVGDPASLPLFVPSAAIRPDGVSVTFNRPVDTTKINLYDQGNQLGAADVTLWGQRLVQFAVRSFSTQLALASRSSRQECSRQLAPVTRLVRWLPIPIR